MSLRKEMKQLQAEATNQGWEVRILTSGHLCWVSPEGRKVFGAQTPSDPRAILNHRSILRRYGFRVVALQEKSK